MQCNGFRIHKDQYEKRKSNKKMMQNTHTNTLTEPDCWEPHLCELYWIHKKKVYMTPYITHTYANLNDMQAALPDMDDQTDR